MGSIDDIMQLCRLCLVKDQVNIPIFDETSDIRQTFLKINQCLPVKVSRDDNLPKKICDGCSYKLDMLYVFRNTSVDSEKQLVSWLSQLGSACSLPQTIVKDGTTKPEIMVKQETFETTEARLDGDNNELVDAHQELGVDAHSYIIQQQKLPYQQDFAAFGEPSGSTVSEEPPPKKAKRAATVKKHVPLETEEDALETAMQITKAEQEEDSDDVDQPDYVDAPSTSADDQPGPSGVGKGTIEAPLSEVKAFPGQFSCQKCPKVFSTKSKLTVHSRIHRERTVPCDQCPLMFHSQSQMKLHCMRHHAKEYPFKCDSCKLGFITARQLSEHQEVRHQGLRFPCSVCRMQFRSKSYLNQHMRLQHNPDYVRVIYTCQKCFKVFKLKRRYNDHMKKHEGIIEKYVCDQCGKILYSKDGFYLHKKIHTGEKPHVCEFCGKGFSTRPKLRVHSVTHTKEKPFKCNLCERSFTQKGTLNIHMRYHSGERPYECKICKKGFVSRTMLRVHKCKL